MDMFNSDLNYSCAIVNGAAFRLIMNVVSEAVYGGPLTCDSQVIKSLYEFMESDRCRIDVSLL